MTTDTRGRPSDGAAGIGTAVGISGGVSANSRLRRDALARGEQEGVPVFIPSLKLSTDNAAMIAAAAFVKLERREFTGLDVTAQANLALA